MDIRVDALRKIHPAVATVGGFQEATDLTRGIDGVGVMPVGQNVADVGRNGLDGVKVIMTTALGNSKNVMGAFRGGCEAYIVKPVEKKKLFEEIEKLGLEQFNF